MREGTGTALPKPLRTQLQADRERSLSGGTRKVVVPKSLGVLSPTGSAGSPTLATIPSTVPSTDALSVTVSSPVPTPSVSAPLALLPGSPLVPPFQLDATEDDHFAHEVRSTSTLSVVATPSTITAATGETVMSREPSREPSEVTIPLEAKETKRRGRPKKQRKPSGHSQNERNKPTRRRD